MIFTILTVAADPLSLNPTPDERFRRNVQQLGGFLLVGFALLSLHLLREQIVEGHHGWPAFPIDALIQSVKQLGFRSRTQDSP